MSEAARKSVYCQRGSVSISQQGHINRPVLDSKNVGSEGCTDTDTDILSLHYFAIGYTVLFCIDYHSS